MRVYYRGASTIVHIQNLKLVHFILDRPVFSNDLALTYRTNARIKSKRKVWFYDYSLYKFSILLFCVVFLEFQMITPISFFSNSPNA